MVLIITVIGAFFGLPFGLGIRHRMDAKSPDIAPALVGLVILTLMAGAGFFTFLVAQQVFSQPLH
jgi:hypothetical protein